MGQFTEQKKVIKIFRKLNNCADFLFGWQINNCKWNYVNNFSSKYEDKIILNSGKKINFLEGL